MRQILLALLAALPLSALADNVKVLYMTTSRQTGNSVETMLEDNDHFVGPKVYPSTGKMFVNGRTWNLDRIKEIRFDVREVDGILQVEDSRQSQKDGHVYNLNGQLVREHADGLKGLPKGIYMMNGKKYIVR